MTYMSKDTLPKLLSFLCFIFPPTILADGAVVNTNPYGGGQTPVEGSAGSGVYNPIGAPRTGAPTRLDVNSKKHFWEYGAGQELSVIQNRTYTKAHKITLGLNAGLISHDPFLTTAPLGGSIGYNFTEYLGVNFLGWFTMTSNSSAYDAFVTQVGFGSNSNRIKSILGGELQASLLYGKLSVIGKAIIHFDITAMGGVGAVMAANGTSIAPWVGIGQQAYLSKGLSLRLEYRLLMYQENVVELFRAPNIGKVIATRFVFGGSVFLGVNLLLL